MANQGKIIKNERRNPLEVKMLDAIMLGLGVVTEKNEYHFTGVGLHVAARQCAEVLLEETNELKLWLEYYKENEKVHNETYGQMKEYAKSMEGQMIDFAKWFKEEGYTWHHEGWYKGGASVTSIRSDEQLIAKYLAKD